jgi:uncharacterized FlgJ-related protein
MAEVDKTTHNMKIPSSLVLLMAVALIAFTGCSKKNAEGGNYQGVWQMTRP